MNRHFAAFLWRLDGLEPPGKLPLELEPYRDFDWTKIPRSTGDLGLTKEEWAYVCDHTLDSAEIMIQAYPYVSLDPYARTEPLREPPADRPAPAAAAHRRTAVPSKGTGPPR